MSNTLKNTSLLVKELAIGYSLDQTICGGINFKIKHGTIFGLIGKNGTGKSTLLKTLMGQQEAMHCEVWIGDLHLSTLNFHDLAKQIAVVLTDRPSVVNMKVRELVETGRIPHSGFFGGLSKEDHIAVEKAIVECGIKELENKTTDNLSDGEFQKVLIAKAIAQETPILLLDEPTSFLDYTSKVEIIRLLKHVTRHENKIVIISSHDLELLLKHVDLCLLLEKNDKYKLDTPQNLLYSGALEDLTGGEKLDIFE